MSLGIVDILKFTAILVADNLVSDLLLVTLSRLRLTRTLFRGCNCLYGSFFV